MSQHLSSSEYEEYSVGVTSVYLSVYLCLLCSGQIKTIKTENLLTLLHSAMTEK